MGATVGQAYTVQTQLRVRVDELEAADVNAAAREILADPPRNLSKIDPELANWLLRIESKLDCLLATMGLPQDSAALAGSPIDLELSEEGFALFDVDAYSEGAWVQVELDLPGPPLHRVTCIARAMGNESRASTSVVRFGFEILREEDRLAILAHNLDIQRRELRLRSGIAGVPG